MAGERSVRISFEAREELSRAIEQIDEALGGMDKSLGQSSAMLGVTDEAARQLKDELDDVQEETNEATVSLAGLAGELGILDAQLSGLRGGEIDIDIDDPDNTDLEEIRSKVVAKLEAMDDPDLDIKSDLSTNELAKEIKKASTYVDSVSSADKPVADMLIDLDEASLIRELRTAQSEAQEAAGNIEVGAEVPEDEAANISADASNAADAAEDAAGDVDVKLNVPKGQQDKIQMNLGKFTKSLEQTRSAIIDLTLNIPEGQKSKIQMNLGAMTKAIESTRSADIDLDVDLDASDDILELAALVSAMNATEAQAFSTALSTRSAASGIDEMGDEATEAAAETTLLSQAVNLLSLNTTALSLNLGMFNIALGNISTQLPMLIASVGTLATGLIGLASAAGLAAVGVSGIFAGGLLSEMTRLEENFSNIESSAEALQAIMRSLGRAFMTAMAPLSELNGATDVFYNTINSLLTTTNAFAQGIANSFEFAGDAAEDIMSLSEFMNVIGSTWSDNLNQIVGATQNMSARLLPIFADLLVFIIEGFDNFLNFITRFTQELSKIGPAFGDLLSFTRELIDLGSTVLQGLLPVFVGLLSIATEIAAVFNSINPAIIRNVAGFALLAVATKSVFDSLMLAYNGIKALSGAMWASTIVQDALMVRQVSLAAGYGSLAATLNAYVFGIRAAISATWQWIGAQLAQIPIIGTTLSSIWALVGAKLSSAAASISQATSAWLASSALGTLAAAAVGAMASLWGYVSGALASAAATLGLAGAYSVLSAATGGLLTALPALVTALIAIVGAGAAVVGVLGNLGGVTGGLGSTLNAIKSILFTIGNFLLSVFIAAWNVIAVAIESVIFQVQRLIDWLMQFKFVQDIVSGTSAGLQQLADTFKALPGLAKSAFGAIASGIEDLINKLPDSVKSALGISGDFSFGEMGRDGSMTVTRSDIISNSEDAASAIGGLTGSKANEFNYNEENVNNVSQEINADPEDKASLSRVVKDAMEEADSFERRRNGFTGN